MQIDNYAVAIIDELGNEEWHVLPFTDACIARYINVGRRHITDAGHTAHNCRFNVVEINNIPVVEVKSTKKIKKNEQLFVDYGDKDWIDRKHATK